MNDMTTSPGMKPGVYLKLDNEAYHAGPGISKSGLWTIDQQTPAHYKFPAPRDEETTQAIATKAFGTAAHIAVLEPNRFEQAVYRGPDDRRGNKWKDAEEFCQFEKKTLLVASAYDNVLALRDTVHADPWVNSIITGGEPVVEASGYWIDEETGELCRCRPDLYRRDLGVIVDLKSTISAHPDAFAKSVINYGYHAQEAFYTDGWNALLNAKRKPDRKVKAKTDEDVDQELKGYAPGGVQGFVFLAWEKKSPYAFGVYELPPSIVEEGRAIMRRSLSKYAECRKANRWPGYSEGVQELSFKRWNYRLTQAPDMLDEEIAA